MADATLATVAFGALASVFAFMALAAARRHKQQDFRSVLFVTGFWCTVGAYFVAFTALRFAYWLESDLAVLQALFYVQTIAGASTIISLAAIMFGVILRAWTSGFATGAFLGLAMLTVAFIFSEGIRQTVADHWGVEFLPESTFARVMVAVVYMAMPLAMAIMVSWAARKADARLQRRLGLFSLSVVLMYLPNAVKYVTTFEGVTNLVFAVVMTAGAVAGWRAYAGAGLPGSSGNG